MYIYFFVQNFHLYEQQCIIFVLTGQNCLDVAINYGDARIIALVLAKSNILPKNKDSGKGNEKKPQPASKPASSVQEKVKEKKCISSYI